MRPAMPVLKHFLRAVWKQALVTLHMEKWPNTYRAQVALRPQIPAMPRADPIRQPSHAIGTASHSGHSAGIPSDAYFCTVALDLAQ